MSCLTFPSDKSTILYSRLHSLYYPLLGKRPTWEIYSRTMPPRVKKQTYVNGVQFLTFVLDFFLGSSQEFRSVDIIKPRLLQLNF